MQLRFETLASKILIGQQQTMSLVEDTTGELFRSFMPRRKEIKQAKDQWVYDLRIYPVNYFSPFNPTTSFTKWALVEVEEEEQLPVDMETFLLSGGKYAVFTPDRRSNDPNIFQYIFGEWLPSSGFVLDDRPHFERLDSKGKRNNPEADEEFWIPIKSTEDGA